MVVIESPQKATTKKGYLARCRGVAGTELQKKIAQDEEEYEETNESQRLPVESLASPRRN